MEYTNSVLKISSHVIWKVETFIEEDTRNLVHRTMTAQSPSKSAPWDFTQFSQSPSAAPMYFPESHWWSKISYLSKGIWVLGKVRSRRVPSLGCTGTCVAWVICCFAKKLCTRCDPWAGTLSWWCCPPPGAHSCGLLNHPNSFHGGMFKLNAKFDGDSLLYSLSSHCMWWSHSTGAHTMASTIPNN